MLRSRIVSVPRWPPSGTVNMVLLPAALPEDDAPCQEEGETGYPDESIANPSEPVSGVMTVVKKSPDEMGAAGQAGNGVKFPCPSWRTLRIRGGVVEGVFLGFKHSCIF